LCNWSQLSSFVYEINTLSTDYFACGNHFCQAQTVTLYGYVQKLFPVTRLQESCRKMVRKESNHRSRQDYFLYWQALRKAGSILWSWLKGERVGLRPKVIATPVTLSSHYAMNRRAGAQKAGYGMAINNRSSNCFYQSLTQG
jgi:hypothetical protein